MELKDFFDFRFKMASKPQQELTNVSTKRKQKKFDLGCDVDKEEIFTYPYLADVETTAYIKDHGRIMIIIRGPNSTLKATLSEMILNEYPTAQHCCADHYFSKTFNAPDRTRDTLKLSHIYCEKKVQAACVKKESPIIVQNTHIRKFEFQKYIDMASKYNYTVIMAITLYKFNVTAEALDAISPDGLNVQYFRNRLRQWEDLPPLFTGWFLSPEDESHVLKLLQTTLPALLSDGKFCHVFDIYDIDGMWKYFVARKKLYCVAGYSSDKYTMKNYYLSDMVQECYGKSYSISILGYLVTASTIMGIVKVTDEMSQLVLKEKKNTKDNLFPQFNSLDLNSNDYKATILIDHKNEKDGKSPMLEDWQEDEEINTETCRLLHLAQKRFEPFDVHDIEENFFTILGSLTQDLQYTELENDIHVCRLADNKWILKPSKKIGVKTIFTGLYV